MLKTGISFFLFVFILCSCESPQPSPTERILAGDYSAYKELDSCNCNDLTKKDNKYHDKIDSLYTGRCLTYYGISGTKMGEKQIFKGQLHGYSYVFGKQGDTLTKVLYQYGKLIPNTNKNFQCDCEDLKNKKNTKTLNQIPFTGTCYKYYQGTNAKYMEKHYKNGLLDGFYIIYDKQGNVLTNTLYQNGKVVG